QSYKAVLDKCDENDSSSCLWDSFGHPPNHLGWLGLDAMIIGITMISHLSGIKSLLNLRHIPIWSNQTVQLKKWAKAFSFIRPGLNLRELRQANASPNVTQEAKALAQHVAKYK